MPDITRHSPKEEAVYNTDSVLANCTAVDMRLMSSAIITLLSGSATAIQPYYSDKEDGTFRKLNSQDGENNSMTIPVGEGMDLHPSCFPIKWLKLRAGTGTGTFLVMPKG